MSDIDGTLPPDDGDDGTDITLGGIEPIEIQDEMERSFLDYAMSVIMARALLARSDRRELVQMAKSVEEGQSAEIEQMKSMLAARGAQPLASILD